MITIRRVTSQDQPQVAQLIHEIMEQEFKEDSPAYPTHDIQNIEKTYGGLGEAFFVAINGTRVVGTAAIKKEDDRVALLRRLFVAPAYRKQRIGLKLIDRALQFCDEMGYQEVVFKTTSRMQAAAKTCQKRGFVQRAKLQLGDVELLKFVCLLPNGHKKINKKG